MGPVQSLNEDYKEGTGMTVWQLLHVLSSSEPYTFFIMGASSDPTYDTRVRAHEHERKVHGFASECE